MIEILFVVSFVISLASISAVILLTHQLQGDYKSDFLNNYFYYLIAFLAFGFYASWTQILMRNLLTGLEISPVITDRIGYLLPVLGIPFLLIAWLMQIRLMYSIRSRNMKSVYGLLYFIIFLILIITLYVVIKYGGFETGSNIDLRTMVFSILIGLDLLMWIIAFLIGLLSLKNITEKNKKSLYTNFLIFLGLSILLRYVLSPLMFYHPLIMPGFLVLFFVSFILPLLYIRKYADDLFPQVALETNEDVDLEKFLTKYQISRRESEIISEICKGKSNKEIAEDLFISLQTVKDHTHRIYTKVGINSRMQLLQKVKVR